MISEKILPQVLRLHLFLVILLGSGAMITGLPARGVVFGGGLMALSFVLLWAIAKLMLDKERRRLLAGLAALKVLLYLGLVAAVLSGRLVVDGAGFAAGVSCFLLATVIAAWRGSGRKVTA